MNVFFTSQLFVGAIIIIGLFTYILIGPAEYRENKKQQKLKNKTKP
jgi:hypothetical protein